MRKEKGGCQYAGTNPEGPGNHVRQGTGPANLCLEKTDRVTIGYDTNPGIHHRLCQVLGVTDDNLHALY